MSLKAILFGSIGTLVETSEMQRRSFNKAFAEFGLDWNWTRDDYRNQLGQSGGASRIAAYASQLGQTVDAYEVHAAKTRIFNDDMETASLVPREGVLDIIAFAREHGLKLGFVTSTSKDNIETVFKALGNTLTSDDFDFVGDASMVGASKPAPAIYIKALEYLNVSSGECVAIEDSQPSVQAALDANIPCIAFPGANTGNQDYSKATKVVARLTSQTVTSIRALA